MSGGGRDFAGTFWRVGGERYRKCRSLPTVCLRNDTETAALPMVSGFLPPQAELTHLPSHRCFNRHPMHANKHITTLSRRSERKRHAKSRRGAETLEVILALPALLIATIAIFQFGFIMLVHQAVTAAAVEGVREAAKDQSTTVAAAMEVQRILGIHRLSFSTNSTNSIDDVRVLVERFGSPTDQVGNSTLPCSAQGGTLQLNQVRVTVCVRMTNADGRPVPNWLSSFGFTLVGRTLEASAIAVAE